MQYRNRFGRGAWAGSGTRPWGSRLRGGGRHQLPGMAGWAQHGWLQLLRERLTVRKARLRALSRQLDALDARLATAMGVGGRRERQGSGRRGRLWESAQRSRVGRAAARRAMRMEGGYYDPIDVQGAEEEVAMGADETQGREEETEESAESQGEQRTRGGARTRRSKRSRS
jgi:hypothetical protein